MRDAANFLRKGNYFPSLLEPRRTAEKALLEVVQEAYLKGVVSSICSRITWEAQPSR